VSKYGLLFAARSGDTPDPIRKKEPRQSRAQDQPRPDAGNGAGLGWADPVCGSGRFSAAFSPSPLTYYPSLRFAGRIIWPWVGFHPAIRLGPRV